jgi:hypothetical protein
MSRAARHKALFFAVTFLLTGYVFLNTYEVLFNKDIPIASSIKKVAAQGVINEAAQDFSAKADSDEADSDPALTGLDHFEIPAIKAKVKIEESRKVNGQWYERPSAAHYIGLNKNQFGVTVDYLLYTSKSWRTIPSPDQIETGMEVKVYYGHGAVSSFSVAEKKLLPIDHSLLVSKSEGRQMLLVIEDPANSVYYGYSLVLEGK